MPSIDRRPEQSSITPRGRNPVCTIVLAVAMSTLVASTVMAQDADQLAERLRSPEVGVRAEAVARLNAMPVSALSPASRAAMIALLEQEATGHAPASSDTTSSADETYDEYIIDLTAGVLRLQDPSALRGLTLLGIQTGQDVQRYVASFGARSLPFLNEAWQANVNARPSIIATWTLSASLAGPNALAKDDRQTVLAAILAASHDYPIAVAIAARDGSLVALLPVLADLASPSSDEVTRSRAEMAVAVLTPVRAALSPLALLDETMQWLAGFCRAESSQRGVRNGVCNALENRFAAARGHIAAQRIIPAANGLAHIENDAIDALSKGALTSAESALIAGNARYIRSRL